MRRLLTVAVSVPALFLAACSGTETPPQPNGHHQPPAGTHGSLAECLQEHGLSESSGRATVLGPPADADPTAWHEAMRACAPLGPGPAKP